ncbi:MAG: dihydrodipicolinate synthase family protein [Cyclobacteriaceae bacterium]
MNLSKGVYAASITPLKNDLSVDLKKLVSYNKMLLANGCDGVVIMGTNGEANSFSVNERRDILTHCIKGGISAQKIMFGTGCCALPDTVELINHALGLGVNNLLVLPPFYYKGVSDQGVYDYYKVLIDTINDQSVNIYLYHFPRLSGVSFSHDLIERLINDFPNEIVGIKDSTGDFENMLAMIQRFPGFNVFSGTETHLTETLKNGGMGAVSGTVNVTHNLAGMVYNNSSSHEADKLQGRLSQVRKICEKYPLIPLMKLLRSQIDEDDTWLIMRPPIVPLHMWDEQDTNFILQELKAHK